MSIEKKSSKKLPDKPDVIYYLHESFFYQLYHDTVPLAPNTFFRPSPTHPFNIELSQTRLDIFLAFVATLPERHIIKFITQGGYLGQIFPAVFSEIQMLLGDSFKKRLFDKDYFYLPNEEKYKQLLEKGLCQNHVERNVLILPQTKISAFNHIAHIEIFPFSISDNDDELVTMLQCAKHNTISAGISQHKQ